MAMVFHTLVETITTELQVDAWRVRSFSAVYENPKGVLGVFYV